MRAIYRTEDGDSRTMAVRSGQNLVETVDGVLGSPWVEDNSDPQEQKLLERVVASGNMKQAWKQVKQNRGGKGIDGRTIAGTQTFLKTQWPVIRQSILDESFQPWPVKRVEIPKPGGGMRKLGIPTVVDRLIQQAICQILTSIFDPEFFEFSFGFRPGRSAHDAVRKVKEYQEKSAVDRPWRRKFLGFSSHKLYGKIRTSVPKVTLAQFRANMKMFFWQGRSWNMERFIAGLLNPALRGWLQYFSLGTSRRQLIKLDYWILRRLRCIKWRQWKRGATRLKKLRGLGINDDRAFAAYSRKGPWASVGHPALRHALSPSYFLSLGLYILTDSFETMRTTST